MADQTLNAQERIDILKQQQLNDVEPVLDLFKKEACWAEKEKLLLILEEKMDNISEEAKELHSQLLLTNNKKGLMNQVHDIQNQNAAYLREIIKFINKTEKIAA